MQKLWWIVICGLVDVTYIVSASDFDVVAGNDMQTFLLLSYYKVMTQNKKIYIHKSIHFHSYKLFTKFGHFFVLFSANGHKSIVIFCMPMMTIINLYYNDKENRPCLYLPNYACPDSISCAAHGSTAKGGWEFYCPVGKRGK